MTSPLRNLAVQLDSSDAFDVRDFAVQQRISSLFEITITALSDNADVDFDAIVGRPASFRMHDDTRGLVPVRFWTGLCNHIEQVAVEETGVSTYQISIVPTLWLATQRRNHRMFQQISELDIARKLLAEWGIEPTVRMASVYKKRKYRVQYAESDFAFLCRMLEDAGISFYFEQGKAETKLVLSDAPQSNEPRPAPIAFRDHPPMAHEREYVTGVHVGQRVRPGRYTLRDHDARLPASYKLLASAEAASAGVESRLERFHYAPGAFLFGTDQGEDTPYADDKGKTRTDEKEGRAVAGKRLEAKRASAKVATFETNAIDLAPGVVMSILDHPRSDLAAGKPLLVVEATHRGAAGGAWTHRCEVRPAELAFRPALKTRKPKISGVESATVVGPAGQEIHTDEFGRVRVHFHWDRESGMDQNSSCWIHVSQPWGGAGYGGSNLPRIGQEVLVDFLGGDPDRPVITGRVYTNLQKSPYTLPQNKTQSGWKSSSSPQTGGYNEIMFEDAAGQELVRMQAEKDLHKLVKNDERVTIGHDRTKLVQNDDAFTVGNNRTKVVQNDENVTIGNNRTKMVQVDDALTVGNNRTKTVQNDESVTIGNNHTRNVQNDESVTIGNDHTRQVQGSESATIGQDLVHTVMANARELTGLMKSVMVGVSRSTQVGMIDSTMVGESHVVMVSPPGEGLSAGSVTRTMMKENYVEAGTDGGATVTLDDKKITLVSDANDADSAEVEMTDTIVLEAKTSATITIGDKTIALDADAEADASAQVTLGTNKIVLDTGKGATLTMDGKKITLDSSGATLTMEGPAITITANTVTITGQAAVDVHGKPINLNC